MTNIKTILISITLVIASNQAIASGIPTVDAANIANTIAENLKTIAEMQKQLDALNSQIKQAKQFSEETKNRLEGNWKLSDVINNDQFLNSLPKDAKDILTDGMTITGLRDKYGLKTDNEEEQKRFDNLMALRERTEHNYNNTVNRLKSLKQIKELNDSANTPAQKADVANKLALLQLEFAQEQMALQQAESQFKAQQAIEYNLREEKFRQSIRQGEKEYLSRFSK
ncbi:type IV secretion system protein [Gilliamella sp. BG6]|uniref:type IV secretion system protein n=1 Tax=unclassified Gilliamella TaxID=2685620 RepID=UPI0039884580